MGRSGFWNLTELSDGDLERDLRGLLCTSRRTEARIVAHLAELDARRLHLKAGGHSLFAYCLEHLGLSEMEAFYRITAARLARKYPVIFELLEQGRIHLTGICMVRRCLTADNHAELLELISGKSKRQIEQVVADRFPRADVPERVQRLPALEPLSPERYGLHLTISRELKEKLELARDLMSHANPAGDLALVIERALDPFLEKLQSRRFGMTGRPSLEPTLKKKTTEPTKRQGPRKRQHIAQETRRDVTSRDGLRCSFVGQNGVRCTSRAYLQLHHEHAWAKGGSDEANNLKVLCAAHNRLLAEMEYGQGHVERAIAHERRR